MSESKDDSGVSIPDEQLPEDLVPSEDNPLAEGLPDGETVGDLLHEGKPADGAEETQSDADEPGDHQSDGAASEESDG
ncbi:hypothetical protein [Nocardioides pelophilus]|uniref:hypothetical protein n=1 Tax=Nocardioides pelophilus TaxID=2172019 RepID=UPI0015FF8E4A|nr:hypothetical protein [Nocardioides pelophilus]